MRLHSLVARLVGIAVLVLSGCQLYFASPPPDAPEGCGGGCDSGGNFCPALPEPGQSCWDQALSCPYGGDACGQNQTICYCSGSRWACGAPGDAGIVDAAAPSCGVIEAEHVPEHLGWTLSCGEADHGGESLTADEVNATLSFGFTGTSLDVYYQKGPNLGTFSVAIDSGPPVLVSAYQPTTFTFQNRTAIATALADGPHTATITCTSLFCDIDYFDVACD